MPKAAKIKKTSKKVVTKKRHILLKNRLAFYLSISIALVVIIWWAVLAFYIPNQHTKNLIYYNNLDLSDAAKAKYTNHAILDVKNFGSQNNVRRELVSFNVPKDNLSEYAMMTLPAAKAPGGKYPVIVLCHGYTNPQSYSTLDSYVSDMEFYSQHGFAVIKPDYRGNGFSVTSGTPDGAYYSMSYNTDVMSLIAAIQKTAYLDKNQINLWGHSMGGYIALRAAVLSPQIKNLILLSAPVGTPKDLYASYVAISDQTNPVALEIRNQQLTEHGTPLSNPAFWAQTSPINYLDKLRAHVQIYVGANDQIVPPKFSADLDKALATKKIAHSYTVYPGGGHSLIAERPQIWQASLKQLSTKP